MFAWQYIGDGLPLTLNEVAEPTAGPGELVIAVKGSGLCKSDAGLLDGVISYLLPGGNITLGHEIAGIVTEVGEGVTGWEVGDRAAINGKVEGPGTGRDGGYAPFVSTQAEFCVKVPEGVSWDQAAVSTDAAMTSYHALTARGNVKDGTKVAIVGFGGLGSLATSIALGLGAEVYVAETRESLHDTIAATGVRGVSSSVLDFKDRELDVIVDMAGYESVVQNAIATMPRGGRIVKVGLGSREATLDVADLTMREIELVGSQGGTVAENALVLDMMNAGKLTAKTTVIDFNDIPAGIDRLRKGEVEGRLAVLFD